MPGTGISYDNTKEIAYITFYKYDTFTCCTCSTCQVLLDECTDWSRIHGKPKGSEGGGSGKGRGSDGGRGQQKNVLDHISNW